ncbi:pyrroline-5-carboxylate reductase family protein [Phyllobacterium endophyticum]|uniref:Pyrroline-5-carboxylate reductase n=1 Tax=Phyllobacterium endophyticum TaxID=1149773 RepID=A0A2P7AQS6_9HYPH|nr:pyrroline-5-carboxylate reductase dimerization domain-containing protein [Phyllobacterium endophyticum]MBB3236962.1 pyrroline-5-carboxylate reductase [Phyllobacterium endophyticum]PSH56540.1 pyrroline-5-carboxylate reductase [Phyllobacterium endophyticum]TYR44461.1 pyrroline-5-carboxylate reductase [Phyllobacterium endophyticum]
MSGSVRIGIVGGGGWLGRAIAGSILEAGLATPQSLALSYRSQQADRLASAFWTTDNQALADRSDVILLSVRPLDWANLPLHANGKLVISVMAGIRLSALSQHHHSARVVRALPNAAAEVKNSYTPWIGSKGVTDEDRAIVRAIFEACGIQDEVSQESHIDYLTGLTGSGPAFPALLAAAMMKDALAHGLPADIASRAVNTVVKGAGRLLEHQDQSADDIVEAFLNYRGTTAAAIEQMREAGFDRAVATGLKAAFRKSVSMGDAAEHT